MNRSNYYSAKQLFFIKLLLCPKKGQVQTCEK
jgi:hypothetical protein